MSETASPLRTSSANDPACGSRQSVSQRARSGPGPASAQTQTYTETTRTEVKPVVITGEVVRYEPGHVIVVRSDKGEVSYTLMPSITVPAEVRVGRTVSLYTEPGEDGATVVKRVTTTSVTPSGHLKSTTETTRTSPSGETTTETS